MRAQLALTAPGLSLELGTPERKIIDACAEAVSEAYIDQYLLGSLLDMDNKVGLELEQWVGIFGYGRLQGRAAEGVVRVSMSTPSSTDQTIPQGTQFHTKQGVAGTAQGQPLYFSSTQTVVLTAGSTSVDVPVRCSIVGTVGNVPPDSITYVGGVIAAGTATNLVAFTGGVNVETDAELRARFKETFLRNIAGTSDWYRNLALQNSRVSRVAVFGPTNLYRTQIEAPASNTALSVAADVKYVWDGMHSCFSNLGQDDEIFYSPTYDYSLSSGSSPVFTRIDDGEIETGQVVDLEFQYTTRSSRNDPANGITNKVDVFVDGVESTPVTEKALVTATTLSATSSDLLYTGNFERVGSSGTPSATNRFMRLGSTPIVSFPATITIGSTVYTQGEHYHLLRDITLRAGSPFEVSGIEWDDSGPSTGTEVTLNYIYNRVPEMLTHLMASTKQVCSDVMVHQARFTHLRVCLSIQYEQGITVSVVNAGIEDRLKAYFSGLGYGAWVKISNLALAVQQVLGVADVKLTTDSENPVTYGIEEYNDPNDPTPDAVYTGDFKLRDCALPVYLEAVITRKAAP